MIIGFSSGCLYKQHHPLAKETFASFAALGCNAIEIACPREADLLAGIKEEDLEKFSYISLHSPCLKGLSLQEIEDIFVSIKEFASRFVVRSVVVHPDEVEDWAALRRYGLPLAVENMDVNKMSFREIGDFERLFAREKELKFVLDIAHLDGLTESPGQFISRFRERLDHVHVSTGSSHDLLQTMPDPLVLSILPDVPVIIESGLENIEDGMRELEYINKVVDKK